MARLPFYWGVGIENCWMAEHNEPDRPPKRLLDVFLQMQHYIRWQEDLDRAAELGINAIRYSVPWYKANPKPGVFDWDWISKPINYLVKEKGITPIIDIIHYGTPLWMENGVLNHAYPQRIAEYAVAFAQEFKGLVNHYTPHNEPQVSAYYGGYNAYWPPYLVGLDGWAKVGLNVARGMVLSAQALRSVQPDVVLISADCLVSPNPELVRQELSAALRVEEQVEFDYLVKTFPACLAYGKVPEDSPFARVLITLGIKKNDIRWFTENAQAPDILGHNYYPMLMEDQNGGLQECLANGKDILKKRLLEAFKFFNRPVYLTETSGGVTSEEKKRWMENILQVITGLQEEGIPVVGLNWWPLYETIQWEYRDNSKSISECIYNGSWNNGLYLIDEQADGQLNRVSSGAEIGYRDLINHGKLLMAKKT